MAKVAKRRIRATMAGMGDRLLGYEAITANRHSLNIVKLALVLTYGLGRLLMKGWKYRTSLYTVKTMRTGLDDERKENVPK